MKKISKASSNYLLGDGKDLSGHWTGKITICLPLDTFTHLSRTRKTLYTARIINYVATLPEIVAQFLVSGTKLMTEEISSLLKQK